MNNATDILRAEHEAIISMLDATEAVARNISAGDLPPAGTLQGLLEFFRIFADRCHHGKEEDLLFPLLETKGFPRSGGPVGVMLYEHEQGRELIGQMTAAADQFSAGVQEAAHAWARSASGYAALLRAHIHKENHILFAMAERLLTSAEQSELAAAFDRLEVEKMGAGTHDRLHHLMHQLRAEIFNHSAVA